MLRPEPSRRPFVRFDDPAARRFIALGLSALALIAAESAAFAQKKPPGTGTDMELDPDATPPPPAEPPPLPPAEEGAWGVGGDEGEGKFAPSGKTGAAKREEEEKAEQAKPEDWRTLPPRDLGLDVVIGFGEIRDIRSDSNVTKTTVASFVPHFAWRLNETWSLGVMFPVARGSVDGPLDQDEFDVAALGNLTASVGAKFKLRRNMRLPISVSLALPTAAGDMYPKPEDKGSKPQALVNQAAASARGWEEQAPFAPNRFGFVPSVGYTYDTRVLHFAANTKFELMVRTGGEESPSADQGLIAGTTYNWVTGASFFYDFLDGMVSPGLRTWLAVTKLPISTPSTDYSGAQFVIEPDVNSTIPINQKMAVRAGIGFVVPLGGSLGAGTNGSINGFRLRAALAF
jgi:hypothetical protein